MYNKSLVKFGVHGFNEFFFASFILLSNYFQLYKINLDKML